MTFPSAKILEDRQPPRPNCTPTLPPSGSAADAAQDRCRHKDRRRDGGPNQQQVSATGGFQDR
jgi:hypothetical protein